MIFSYFVLSEIFRKFQVFLFRLVFRYEILFKDSLTLHGGGPYQWNSFYIVGTSVMKELTTLNNRFTESEAKKENKLLRSRNFDFTCLYFNIYECLKWLEKPLQLINTNFL